MSRRVSLPTADDLFRPTAEDTPADLSDSPPASPARAKPAAGAAAGSGRSAAKKPGRRPSGRVRHDEKMTVYITAEELLDIEHARLDLRRHHGLAVDRGRLVREALAIVLADLDRQGEDSELVRRLTG